MGQSQKNNLSHLPIGARKKRSASVRARLAAIAKERWRKAKAVGKTSL
jgi:hypothetical protein